MKSVFFGAVLAACLASSASSAAPLDPDEVAGLRVAHCLAASSSSYRVPLGVLLILLEVEGGSLGRVSRNDNGSVDVGPMQVNSYWLPAVAAHWHTDRRSAFAALRDDICANVEAGTWVLRQALDEAHDDLWSGVGLYHSHDPDLEADYLRKVLGAALRLESKTAGASTRSLRQIAKEP